MTNPCPYCQSPTKYADSAIVYGKSYGRILICTAYPKCDAFVGCHKDSGLPKGTLANGRLRDARKRAHAAFDALWRSGNMDRSSAYEWLAQEMALPPSVCHIGMMNEAECHAVVSACQVYPAG